MQIRELGSAAECVQWDAFVQSQADGTFFHLSGWRQVIAEAFGHPTHFLYAAEGEQIVGVLPLAQVRSFLFGNKLVSLPFCVYGGIVAANEAAHAALLAEAGRRARSLGVDYLELRNRAATGDLPAVSRYVTFRRRLDPDPEVNLLAIPRKQRAMIRKGAAKPLEARFDGTVQEFFRIYAESLRNLGTPVLPLRYFEILQRVFADRCGVMTVGMRGARASAAVLSFYFRDEVLPYYGGGTASAREHHAYDFMYWELLVNALSRGCAMFDFGRSRQGTGSYRFKTHWGFEPEPLHYQYDLVRQQELPNVTPDNPRYAAMIGLWRRLPLGITTAIGPLLARNLG
jgi:FemAB-related protein (PEP-CTERM system-associated)